MKRFYKTVDIDALDEGFGVRLDSRALKSPSKSALVLPTRDLAEAVAEEWRSQGEQIDAVSMPMMGFAATTTDRVKPQRGYVVDEIAGYGGSDLLCYRADEPAELVAAQQANWDPMLEWAREALQAELAVTAGIMPVTQAPQALVALRTAVVAVPDWELAPLHTLTTVTGSLVVALATLQGRITPDEAFRLGQIDESHQAQRWGLDWEAEQRMKRLEREIAEAGRFLALVRAG